MSIHQALVRLPARQTKKIFIVLTILTSKSMIRFFFSWLDFHSSERSLEYRYQQFSCLWPDCSQWKHCLSELFREFLNFDFLPPNWVIMLLKLKPSSSFDLLSWSTRAMVIFSMNKSVLLILTLCIKSKMYGSRFSLRPRRKRLLSIQMLLHYRCLNIWWQLAWASQHSSVWNWNSIASIEWVLWSPDIEWSSSTAHIESSE